jgi:hypothetical protein
VDQEPSGSRVRLIFWHPGRVEQWTYNGAVYQVNSMYLLPDGAWTYKARDLAGLNGYTTNVPNTNAELVGAYHQLGRQPRPDR